MNLPLRRRREIVKWMFIGMPLVIAVATIFAVIDLCRPRKGTNGAYLYGLTRLPDGSYDIYRPNVAANEQDVIVKLRLVNTTSPWVHWLSNSEPCWSAVDWSIEILPTSPASLTPTERQNIVAKVFTYTSEQVPVGAAAVPPSGSTVVNGRAVDVHYGRAALWLATRLPGFLLLVWLVTGLALWLTRNDGRDATLCVHCGYNRAGIAAGAVCPECGKRA